MHTTPSRLALLTLLSLCGLNLPATEKIIFKDDFTGAKAEPETVSIRSETSWHGFAKSGGRLPSVKKVDTEAFAGTVLEFSAQGQHTLIAGAFPAVELKKEGDFIQVSLDYRYLYPLKNPTPAFVVGLHDSRGIPVARGNLRRDLEPGAAGSNHVGYRLAKLPLETTEDLQVDLATGLGATFSLKKIASGDSGQKLDSRGMHTIVMKITLLADGNLAFDYSVNGAVRKFATTDSVQVGATRFDEISICPLGRGFDRGPAHNYYIQTTNVRVIHGAQ
ncbi:MAG: hypothetical protein LBK99_03755 [Opitutaceae bacterium]|jgi:hypothetical protein|nr:hypothetical protein [Opitutaceae bacterium]